MLKKLQLVKKAYQNEQFITDQVRNKVLIELADELVLNIDEIIKQNQKDLAKMEATNPKYDRLLLTNERIISIANDIKHVASLPSVLNLVITERTLENGLLLKKTSVPLGVIGVIYEARPNVTLDVFSLCFKSGNACVLKGGSEADSSNKILISIIHKVLIKNNITPNFAFLMPPNREYVYTLLGAKNIIDVCIPRGSKELIDFVRENAKIPVIETGAGIVHTYFDKSGDISLGVNIINNAKTRRVSVCNALDTLIIHEDRLDDLYKLVELLSKKNVQIFADRPSYASLSGFYPKNLLFKASNKSFGQEFLDFKLSIKTVKTLDEAITHIMKYTSGHSEAIIAKDNTAIQKFMQYIDAAAVYANASTAFTDGGQFGMGAEIGISTQKLHARGPMGLNELTSYKWLVFGNGQIR